MPTFLPTNPSGRTGTIQSYVIPNDGFYEIEAWGAQGGSVGGVSGGKGARVKGTFALNEGDILHILVGQMPGTAAGGGGGSFVAFDTGGGVATSTALLVAAGGGSTGDLGYNALSDGKAPVPPATAVNGSNGGGPCGGTGGTGGDGGWASCSSKDNSGFFGGGGGGFDTDGGDGNGEANSGGRAFIDGGAGGVGTTSPTSSGNGGFGGGGGGFGYGSGLNSDEAGGGGGYNGGGGGDFIGSYRGGGGGSYNNGTNPSNESGVRVGEGLVTINQTVPDVFGPSDVTAEVILPEPPVVQVCWTEGPPADWVNPDEVVAEITRVTCFGSQVIATVEDGLSGCFTDRFLPLYQEVGCGIDHDCEVSYTVRYWGYIAGVSGEVTDPIPEGVIIAWPDTDASIPSGWDRVTALDGQYVKGAPAATNPGVTGGASTHAHTSPGHVHVIGDHTHTQPTSGAASGTVNRAQGPDNVVEQRTNHTHSDGSTSISNDLPANSGSASPALGATSNEVSRKEMIMIESDGTEVEFPVGGVGLWNALVPPTNWDLEDTDEDDGSTNTSFLKGATAAGDGSKVKTLVPSHLHSIAAHTHTGITHDHTATNTNSSTTSTFKEPAAGSGTINVNSGATHTHAVTIANAATGSLSSGSGGDSGSVSTDSAVPPYRRVKFIENLSSAVQPIGLIGMWLGTLASIPSGWLLCDGSSGTPDLRNRYPRYATGAVGGTGGGSSHNHSGGSHTHGIGSHTHSRTIHANAGVNVNGAGTSARSRGSHTHTSAATGATAPTRSSVSSGTSSTSTPEPPFTTVAFIMLESPSSTPFDTSVWISSEDQESPSIVIENPTPGNAWIRHPFDEDLNLSICPTVSFGRNRPFGATQGIAGGERIVVSGEPGGRDYQMTIPVTSEADLVALEAILGAALFHYAPTDGPDAWLAANTESVQVIKVKRVRELSLVVVEVEPQPVTPIDYYEELYA